MIICCNCYYDWYSLKMNTSNFWSDIFNGPFEIVEIEEILPREVAESRYGAPLG